MSTGPGRRRKQTARITETRPHSTRCTDTPDTPGVYCTGDNTKPCKEGKWCVYVIGGYMRVCDDDEEDDED